MLSEDFISIGTGNPGVPAYFVLVAQNSGQRSYKADNTHGILGLGLSKLSNGWPTFIGSLKASGIIDRAVFSMYLAYPEPNAREYNTLASNLEIGSYDLNKYSTGEVLVNLSIINPDLYPNINPGYWQAYIDTASIAGIIFIGPSVIFDSGTSLIVVDSFSYTLIYTHYRSVGDCIENGLITCTCSSLSALDSFYFVSNGKTLSVPSERLWAQESGQCVLLIESGEKTWILGDTFLVNYYTIYDMDNLVVSLAPTVISTYSGSIYTNTFIVFLLTLILEVSSSLI